MIDRRLSQMMETTVARAVALKAVAVRAVAMAVEVMAVAPGAVMVVAMTVAAMAAATERTVTVAEYMAKGERRSRKRLFSLKNGHFSSWWRPTGASVSALRAPTAVMRALAYGLKFHLLTAISDKRSFFQVGFGSVTPPAQIFGSP